MKKLIKEEIINSCKFIKNNLITLVIYSIAAAFYISFFSDPSFLDLVFSEYILSILLAIIIFLGLIINLLFLIEPTKENESSPLSICIKSKISYIQKQKKAVSENSLNLISSLAVVLNIGITISFISQLIHNGTIEIIKYLWLIFLANKLIAIYLFGYFVLKNLDEITKICISKPEKNSNKCLKYHLRKKRYYHFFLALLKIIILSAITYCITIKNTELTQQWKYLNMYKDCKKSEPKQPDSCKKSINKLINNNLKPNPYK